MKLPHWLFFSLLLLIFTSFIKCNIDKGLSLVDSEEILKHGIKGEIHFNGEWQNNVAEARLVVAAGLDPNATDLQDSFIFSDPIQVGARQFSYEMSLEPATYEIAAVIFREPGSSWEISNILAVHEPLSACSVLPNPDRPIKITSATTIVDSVDFEVDLSKGAITGTVDFLGDWPADIGFAAVLAFELPFSLIPCGLGIIPVGSESAEYKVLVPEDTYTLAVVVGASLSLTELTFIGECVEPGTQNPCALTVAKNANLQNINLTADLNRLSN
ncbi:MAG: hypothetical protein ACE5HI_14610 [bacterium]